jgi:N-acetylmuramoyl-L-alanine amidase
MLHLKKLLLFASLIFLFSPGFAQDAHPDPFIRITQPEQKRTEVSGSRNYIAGSTCKGCVLTLNGSIVKVYPTGAFAIQLDLSPGDTLFNLEAGVPGGAKMDHRLYYNYSLPVPETSDSTLTISSIITYPEGNLQLAAGDIIRIRVKGLPGCKAVWLDNYPLFEQPAELEGGLRGIYQGSYTVKANDPLLHGNIRVSLTDPRGHQISKPTPYQFNPQREDLVATTTGDLPYLAYGLGTDRLGGAKMGYLDTAVLLHVTGKFNNEYRVQLSGNLTAFIPQEDVKLLPEGTFIPASLTRSWRIYGDDHYDYVSIGLNEKLPYSSQEDPDPSKIIVDVYGATANTNWISQLQGIGEIRSVYYEQPENEVFRIHIDLKHPMLWGYSIYYSGSNLIIRIRHRPADTNLSHLKIAIDAGHGGSNLGSLSPTGIYEKEITLEVSFNLKADLEKSGATVVMTRTNDASIDMAQRTLFLRREAPDLLVSIHMNASEDPIHIRGTSTYYRYPGFQPLSRFIYARMLALGLTGFGNIGGFNFALNGPTEYPNALVEAVFITNPEDEMKILDPNFREKVAQAIVDGIRDFLASASEAK